MKPRSSANCPFGALTDSSGQVTTIVSLGGMAGCYQLTASTLDKSKKKRELKNGGIALGYQQLLGLHGGNRNLLRCRNRAMTLGRPSQRQSLARKLRESEAQPLRAKATVVLSNVGNADLIVNSMTNTGVNPNDFTYVACGTITATESCTFTVQFQPSIAGPESAVLNIASNYSAQPNMTVSMTGSGVVATTTSVTASAITYGLNGTVNVTVAPLATGNVTLRVDGGAATSQPLVNGSATFTVTTPSAGNHTLAATYAAQNGFLGITGPVVSNWVGPVSITANPIAKLSVTALAFGPTAVGTPTTTLANGLTL